MSDAKRDQNRVTTITAVLDTDGTTIENVCADPSVHSLCVEDNTTGSDNGPDGRALHDSNHIPTFLAVSADDGETPVALYVDDDGNLLIDSN